MFLLSKYKLNLLKATKIKIFVMFQKFFLLLFFIQQIIRNVS